MTCHKVTTASVLRIGRPCIHRRWAVITRNSDSDATVRIIHASSPLVQYVHLASCETRCSNPVKLGSSDILEPTVLWQLDAFDHVIVEHSHLTGTICTFWNAVARIWHHKRIKFDVLLTSRALIQDLILMHEEPVSYTHLTLPTIYSV